MIDPSKQPQLHPNRRRFLQTTAGASAVAGSIITNVNHTNADSLTLENLTKDKPNIGCIGTGSRWNAVGPNAMKFGKCVAVCDVDKNHLNGAAARVKKIQGHEPDKYENYKDVLKREDISVVTIVTTDHWHTKIAIEAMQAGKDVYCEKPLTLTIEEGKQICNVVKETGRIFQVGTQQRSEMGLKFLKAVAIVRSGRIGDIKKVTCAIGGAPSSPTLPEIEVPSNLNWDMWLGQAPKVPYRRKDRKSNCHYEFRWWYEYSGGKMTDWGAHHIDIAQWAIDQNGEGQGPIKMTPLMVKHPSKMKDGMPIDSTMYNTATDFKVHCKMTGGVQMMIRATAVDKGFQNGILFEGTKGRLFVNRGKLEGAAVEDLKKNPLPEKLMTDLYGGNKPGGGNAHMKNFFDCIAQKKQPISDVFTHHRAMTTCHLANIAIRLGRVIVWDPVKQEVIGDPQAESMVRRKQREGFEINVPV